MKLSPEEQQMIEMIRAGGSFNVGVVRQDGVYAVVTSDKHYGGGIANIGQSHDSFEDAWNSRVAVPCQWHHGGPKQDL